MFDYYGKPAKNAAADFLSKTTGVSFHSAYVDLITPKIGRETYNPLSEFDYRSLIGRYNGLPSTGQVESFMMEETGCGYESAHMKLGMPKLPEGATDIGGVNLYPVSIPHCI